MPRQLLQEVSTTMAVSNANACRALRLISRTTLTGCLFGLLLARTALVARLTGPVPVVPQQHRAEGRAVAPPSVTARAAGTTAVAADCSRRRRWAARSCCVPAGAGGGAAPPSTRPP